MLTGDNNQDNRWDRIAKEYLESGESLETWSKNHGINEQILRIQVEHGNYIPQSNQEGKDNPTLQTDPPKVNIKEEQSIPEERARSKKRTAEEWRVLISEQIASGMSRREWCGINGISESGMDSAVSRIKRAEKPKGAKAKTSKKSPVFVKAVPDKEKPAGHSVRVPMNGKVMIKFRELIIEADSDYPVSMLSLMLRGILQ